MCNQWFARRTQVQVNSRWESDVAVDVGVRSTSCSGFSWLVWRVASARCSSTHKVKAYLRHTLVVLVVILIEFHRCLVPAPLMCNQKVRKKECLRAQRAPFYCDAKGGGATQQHAQTRRATVHDRSKTAPRRSSLGAK